MTATLPRPHFLPTPIPDTPCSVDSGCQCIAHSQSSSEQTGLNQSLGDLQHLRSFCNAQLLDIAHDEHLAMCGTQGCNRIPQSAPELGPLQSFHWSLAP